MLAVAATPGECPFARFVWSNRAPPRVQFFAWLLVQDRIQSRQNLHRKTNVQQQDAACALCGHPEESADHIIFACPTAAALWHHVGVPGVNEATVSAKNSSLRASLLALGEENSSPRVFFFYSRRSDFKKIIFSPSNFFYHQHALIQRICSNLTQLYLCLLYLKFLIHSR
jgi:hypothetical protein